MIQPKIRFTAIFIIFIIPLLLVTIWFKDGNLLGSGESGLPFYQVQRQLNLLSWAWGEGGLGLNIGIVTAATPTYWVLSLIGGLGVPGFIIQAALFYILFVVAGLFTYLLTKEMFPNLGNRYYLLSALFYWFNPISLVNVWNRFLYNYMFFWAELPLILFLTILGIRKRNLWFAPILTLVLTFFSYSESAIPFDLLLGFIIVSTIIFYSLVESRLREYFFVKFLLIFAATFLFSNFWWITQLFSFLYSSNFSTTATQFFTSQGNLQGLTALSAALGRIEYTIRMMHSSFFEQGPIWARFYSLDILVLVEFLIPLLIFWTIYKYRKTKEVLFLGLFFVFLLYLVKGNLIPFGELFEFIFVKIPVIQVFRNPFEKFGLIMPLFAAPLFVFGLKSFLQTIYLNHFKKIIAFLFTGLVVIFWGFPFWTGLVFTSTNERDVDTLRSYVTKVPEYYEQANKWLNSQGGDFRFISLPLGGEGITYTWDKPYSGVELSSTLFDVPNISFNTSVPYYDKIAGSLERFLMTGINFPSAISFLNVKYLITRDDIDWRTGDIRNPAIVENALSNNSQYQKVAQFGNLKIYSVPENSYQERIYISKSNTKVDPVMDLESFITSTGKQEAIYSSDTVLPNTNWFVINPFKTTYVEKNKAYEVNQSLDRLLYTKYLPGEAFYPLIRIREKFDRIVQADNSANRFIFDLTHMGKRVAEAYLLVERKKDKNLVIQAADSYIQSLEAISNEFPDEFSDSPTNGFRRLEQEEFNKHQVILLKAQELLKQNGQDSLDLAVEKLNNFMVNYGFTTLHHVSDGFDEQKFAAYRFDIEKDGSYDLLLDNSHLEEFYDLNADGFKVQLDDQILTLSDAPLNNYIGSKKLFLSKGTHEIILGIPNSKNLIDADQEIILDSSVKPLVKFNISPFDPYATYEIAYDYWIRKGNQFDFVSFSDNDLIDSKGVVKNYKETISTNGYNNDFLHQTTYLTPRNGASSGEVGFRVQHFKACNDSINIFFLTCDNSKPTEIVIKNFQVKKVFKNPVRFMRRGEETVSQIPSMSFQKINPTEYKINITNATDPYVLVFSELYNSGWKIESGGQKMKSSQLLLNGYANGWLVDKKGDYQLTLKFLPQDLLSIGTKVSLLANVGILIAIIWFVLKKKKIKK